MSVLLKPLALLLAALLIAALAVIGWQRHHAADLTSRLADAQAKQLAAQFEASAARIDVKVITQYVDRVRVIHDTSQTLQREIPTYVTPATDRAFPLPVGFVRLHDAAASGLSTLPAAGLADATASDVAASQAADVIVTNYGLCHETTAQLSALQDWIRERDALQRASP
jgi:cell division protein FtsL